MAMEEHPQEPPQDPPQEPMTLAMAMEQHPQEEPMAEQHPQDLMVELHPQEIIAGDCCRHALRNRPLAIWARPLRTAREHNIVVG